MATKESTTGQCPKIKVVDDDTMDLSYEDRLKALEEEAQSLYAFCIKKRFSEKELVSCISKLHGPPKSTAKKALNDSTSSLIFLSVVFALVGVIYASPSAQNVLAAHYKLATIKVVTSFRHAFITSV